MVKLLKIMLKIQKAGKNRSKVPYVMEIQVLMNYFKGTL
jgi:hypothetical protein